MNGWFGSNGKVVLGMVMVCVVMLLVGSLSRCEGQSSSEAASGPWWEQEKIRFFWGCWYHSTDAGIPMEQVMKNLSQVGATVFVERHWLNLDHARLAHKYGIRYFGHLSVSSQECANQRAARMPARFLPKVKMRWSVNEEGRAYSIRWGEEYLEYTCPLYKPLYEAWFLNPILEAVQTGLVDGFHMDWEPYAYGDWDFSGACYCDDCFGQFLKKKAIDATVPKADRYKCLEERGLIEEYQEDFDQRREEMFREFARRIHQINPEFVFSAYHARVTPLSRGLHTPEVPFFMIDSAGYYENHTRPWWESSYAYHHKLGMRHIAGSWDNSLFGGQAESVVSASQWMYESAINTDGYWMWFQEEFPPDLWRAFWIANRRIGATEQKVGKFLLEGEQDIHFVTPLEWSGSPELGQAIIQRTHHLDGEHLVHVNNVDADRPVQVRLRFPRLPGNSWWTVRDPISDLAYVHDDNQAIWSAEQLAEGIMVSLEKRSELFFHLSPAGSEEHREATRVIASQQIRSMPDHPPTEGSAPAGSAPGGQERLAYLVTENLGYLGSPVRAIGNAIHAIDTSGENQQRLRQLKGYLWSPVWSPDGTRIALCHYSNGRGQIYVMNADGSQAFNLSNNDYCDRSPVWSPDGNKLAFVSDRDGDWEIYVMNSDGSQQRRLTSSPGLDQAPAWSPDGTEIVFESDRGGDFDIYVMNADGSDQHPVIARPGQDHGPVWSPDGSRIACIGQSYGAGWSRQLFVVEADGGAPRAMAGTLYLDALCWSPDSQRIAGVYHGPTHGGALTGLFTINADGTDERKLVQVSAIQPYSREGVEPTWYSMGSASPRWVVKTMGGVCWSPDGTRLAFSSDMSDDGSFYVYTISAEGGEPTRLEETASAWLQQLSWCPR